MAISCTGAFWCTTLRNPGFILIFLQREKEEKKRKRKRKKTPDCWAVRQLSLSHLNPKAKSTGKRSLHSRFPGTQKCIILISKAPLTEGCAVSRHFSEVSSSRGHFRAGWSSVIPLRCIGASGPTVCSGWDDQAYARRNPARQLLQENHISWALFCSINLHPNAPAWHRAWVMGDVMSFPLFSGW